MLFRRNGVWYTRVKLDGRWVKETTNCTDRKAAERVHVQREREAADPAHYAANTTTLSTMIATFLDTPPAKPRAAGTQRMYEQKARHLARVMGGGTLSAAIDAAAVDEFTRTRLEEGAHRNTISKELITLRQVLRMALRNGVYTQPLEAVLPKWDAGYEPRETWLTRADLDKLLAVLPEHRRHYVRYAVATAGRHSELASAQDGDIDLERGIIFLRSTKTKRKGYGDRHVPITDLTDELVRGVKLPLVAWPDGNRQRDLAAACERAGVAKVSSNDLRRTHGSWLVQGGVGDDTAGRVLGHGSGEMVRKVYGRHTPESLRDNVRAQLDAARGRGTLAGHDNRKNRAKRVPTGDQIMCKTVAISHTSRQGLTGSNGRPADLEA